MSRTEPIAASGNLTRGAAQLMLHLRIGQQTFHPEPQQLKCYGIVKRGQQHQQFTVRCWVRSLRTNSSVAITSLASTTASTREERSGPAIRLEYIF
jgi:hypothetical protein